MKYLSSEMSTNTAINGAPYYTFDHLSEAAGIVHGVFSRIGGESKGAYKSLNTALGVGDDREIVFSNRDIIKKAMGADELVFTHQTHGDHVVIVDNGELAGLKKFKGDALITDITGKCLVIQVADCQPVLLYDPDKKVVANVHSGWRGSVSNITGKTVNAMKSAFGSSPDKILAGIGPSLGPCCAEFINYKTEIPDHLWQYKNEMHHFDFWRMTKNQLEAEGVLTENIRTAGICTKCNTKKFFSYRGEKKTGRFSAVIGLTADSN